MPLVKIVVDSTADLPPQVLAELDISVVPCLLRFGEQTFREGIDITRAEFFARLRTAPYFPSTAAPAPGLFQEVYQRLAIQTDSVLSLHLSSQYSGIFNAARLGAEAVADRLRVVAVDSGQVSLGMGLMAMAAAEAARDGATLEDILRLVDDLRSRTHLLAIIDNLDNLRRSGRVNQLLARIGTLLCIKPILHVHQGDVLLQERVRSWTRAQERLVHLVRALAPLERVALTHIQRPAAADALGLSLADILPPHTYVFEAGITIGIHVGVGAAGVALIQAPK